jgi:hypothetical protein
MQALYVIHPKYNITMQVRKTRGKRNTRDRHVVTKNRVACSCLLSCLSNVWWVSGKLAALCIAANQTTSVLRYVNKFNCNRLSQLIATTLRPKHVAPFCQPPTNHSLLLLSLICSDIACATPHSATPHSDQDGQHSTRLAQRNHVGGPVHHNNHAISRVHE